MASLYHSFCCCSVITSHFCFYFNVANITSQYTLSRILRISTLCKIATVFCLLSTYRLRWKNISSLSTADQFLTTVYPTSATGTYGIGGNKSTKEDVFPSGKGRKCLSCQRIDIMPILALSCYFLCIQFHIVLQIYFSYDLNDNTTILRSVLKTSTHLQILIFQTVRPIGIWWS